MRKIYFIYATIPEDVYNSKIKYMVSNGHDYRWKHGKLFGLYGWTTKSKIIKEFFELRNKYVYTLVKKDIDDEEYDMVKSTYGTLELKLRQYDHVNKSGEIESIDIVTTKDEWRCSTIDHEEYVGEFGPEVYPDLPPSLFKDKLINALDIIGYISDYIYKWGDDDIRSELDNNLSYGVTYKGNRVIAKYEDKVNVLLYLFHYLFYGGSSERRNEE